MCVLEVCGFCCVFDCLARQHQAVIRLTQPHDHRVCLSYLQVDLLQQLELQSAALLLRLEQLRRVVTSTACQYRAFCSWLLKVVQQLENSSSQEASNNSAGGFVLRA